MNVLKVSQTDLDEEFFDFLSRQLFPCVGAKSAMSGGELETLHARNICSAWDDLQIHRELCKFGERIKGESKGFRSFAVLFEQPIDLSEHGFEQALWGRLQSLRDKDRWLSYRNDPRVAHDPQSSDFAFSIGGEGFFVVGMHPRSSRLSRRTPMPVLVFNPFSQFERLRREGRYERMSYVIRRRDENACGSANPMLEHHGDASSARQFSGRALRKDWICPLDRRAT